MTPSLAEEIATESKHVGKKRRCQVNTVMGSLSKKDRDELEQILGADPLDVPPGAIVNVLKRRGHDEITTNAVMHHRRRSCSCFKA